MAVFVHTNQPEIGKVEPTGELAFFRGSYFVPHDEAMEMIAKLQAFYAAHPPEQLKAANTAVERREQPTQGADGWTYRNLSPSTALDSRTDLVYLVQRSDGYIKIGWTGDFRERKKALVKQHGPLQEVLIIPCSQPRAFERYLHSTFLHRHVEGEWFNLTPEDVEIIKGM